MPKSCVGARFGKERQSSQGRKLDFPLGTLHVVGFLQFLENVNLENGQTAVTTSRHFPAVGHSQPPLCWD